jgi:hypothetical protein
MFHAYGVENKMNPNFDIITYDIVKTCGGLPLSIEVMGQFLNVKYCSQIWKEALWRLTVAKALGVGRENEVFWNRLKIDDDLEEEDFFIILDIYIYILSMVIK